MQLCFNTDGLGDFQREEMLDIIAGYGYKAIELACGNWSTAPHIQLDELLASKTIDMFQERAWNYVALGHGHNSSWWREFFSVLGMTGYKGTVSLEMEDLTMDPLAVLQKSTAVLKDALPSLF